MIVIYTPADGTGGEYDAGDLTCGEAEAVCRATDMSWPQLEQALRQQAPSAMRGIAWASRKRAEPTLRYSHFDPRLKDLRARFTTEEIPEFMATEARSSMTDAQRQQVRAEVVAMAVDPAAAQAAVDAVAAPKEQPSATSTSTSESSASDTSG
jgi:hypothetical protein